MVKSNLVSISVGYPMPLQIILKNTQNVASPSPFQQMLQLEASEINSVLPSSTPQVASDFHNIRFKYNYSYIPAWLESINNGVATIWVNIPVSIPANSSITIDMEVDPSLNFDGNYWGEAPQLSSTYAQYDNGASIFPYYQPWGSLSSLPNNWAPASTSQGQTINYASTYTEITVPSTGGWYGIYLYPTPSSLVSTNTVWEFYGNRYTTSYGYIGTNTGPNFGYYQGYNFFEQSSTPIIYLGVNGYYTYASTGYVDTNTNKVYTMQMNSATSLQMFINYSQILSVTGIPAQSPNSFQIGIGHSSQPFYIYWLRTRALSPNGVMPSVEVIA